MSRADDRISSEVNLREVMEEDCERVFELSNELSVRESSINKAAITWEDHCAWFKKKLSDKDHEFYIVHDTENDFLGQVRFQINGPVATISISICPSIRGIGMSHRILYNACKLFFAKRTSVSSVLAYIRPENSRSARSFQKAGFVLVGEEMRQGEVFHLFQLGTSYRTHEV